MYRKFIRKKSIGTTHNQQYFMSAVFTLTFIFFFVFHKQYKNFLFAVLGVNQILFFPLYHIQFLTHLYSTHTSKKSQFFFPKKTSPCYSSRHLLRRREPHLSVQEIQHGLHLQLRPHAVPLRRPALRHTHADRLGSGVVLRSQSELVRGLFG